MAVPAGPIVGLVSTVRVTRLYQSTRSGFRRSGLEKCVAGGADLRRRASSESTVIPAHVYRRRDLGHRLSKTTQPLRARTLARHYLRHGSAFYAFRVDKRPPRRLQILRLAGV